MEKISKWKQRQWRANEEMRRKLHKDLGSGDCLERLLKILSLVIHIWDALIFYLTYEFSRQPRLYLHIYLIKSFEAPQRSVKIKIWVNFLSYSMIGVGMGLMILSSIILKNLADFSLVIFINYVGTCF